MARRPEPRRSVSLGEGSYIPGHQLCRAWGKGRDVRGGGGYLRQSVILSTVFTKCLLGKTLLLIG